jgi:hypothetical protein
MEMANKVHKNIITATGKAHGINHHFNRGASPGNFSTEIIHHYTHNKNDGREKKYMISFVIPPYSPMIPTRTREKYPRGIHLGSTKEQILTGLGDHTNVILNFTT